jgi:hypothetical protein
MHAAEEAVVSDLECAGQPSTQHSAARPASPLQEASAAAAASAGSAAHAQGKVTESCGSWHLEATGGDDAGEVDSRVGRPPALDTGVAESQDTSDAQSPLEAAENMACADSQCCSAAESRFSTGTSSPSPSPPPSQSVPLWLPVIRVTKGYGMPRV